MTSVVTANVTTAGDIAYASIGNTAVTWLSICNYSAGVATANVYIVPNGQTADNTNQILTNLALQVGDTYQIYAAAEKIVLSDGDSIQISANVDNAITTVATYTGI
jgi:hypothetical protein